jgi:hypothetical protein
MDDVKAGIQYAFQTSNPLTFAVSATGHAAMECVMTNMVEDGDIVLVAENGIWGQRAAEMARRNSEANFHSYSKSGFLNSRIIYNSCLRWGRPSPSEPSRRPVQPVRHRVVVVQPPAEALFYHARGVIIGNTSGPRRNRKAVPKVRERFHCRVCEKGSYYFVLRLSFLAIHQQYIKCPKRPKMQVYPNVFPKCLS